MEDFNIGQKIKLTAARKEPQGFYLRGDDPFKQVLLPNAYVPKGFKEGDDIEVFIYLDNEERIIATTLVPKIQLNDFACLMVDASPSLFSLAYRNGLNNSNAIFFGKPHSCNFRSGPTTITDLPE